MRLRAFTAAAVLVFIATAAISHAQCNSEVQPIGERTSGRNLITERMAWGGGLLAVQSSNPNTGIWVTLYDVSGVELASPTSIASNDVKVLALIWNGTDFTLFLRRPTNEVVFQRISLTQLTDPVALRFLTLPEADTLEAIWSTSREQYVLVHAALSASPRTVKAIYYDRKGGWVTDEELGTAAADSFVRVVETQTGTLGIFFEDSAARAVFYARPEPGQKVFTKKVWNAGEDAFVATTSDMFALVRQSGSTVRWKVIDSDGFDVKADSVLMDEDSGAQSVRSFTGNSGDYALTYVGPNVKGVPIYRLHRFDAAGATLSDTPFAIEDAYTAPAGEQDLVWTGRSYLAHARDSFGTNVSYLARFCPMIISIAGPRTVTRGVANIFDANVEGGLPGYTYLWRWNYTESSAASPQLTFPSAGTYEILLKVRDAAKTEMMTTYTVTVVDPPQQGTPKRRAVRK